MNRFLVKLLNNSGFFMSSEIKSSREAYMSLYAVSMIIISSTFCLGPFLGSRCLSFLEVKFSSNCSVWK